MLAIRMQRLGRKGHPTYRVVVQDSRQTPSSGKVVAMLGSYDPHAKTTTIVKEKAEHYLKHGAQPSDRVARLFKTEGIALPDWVKQPEQHTRVLRNTEKLRRNRPVEEKSEEPETPVAPEAPEETPDVAPVETALSTPEETPAEAPAPETEAPETETPAEETKT